MSKFRALVLLAFFTMSLSRASENFYHDFPENDPSHLHDFRSLSFSPDGKKLLVVVCNEEAAKNCNVSQIDIATGKRTRFQFNGDYLYRSARYTSDGRFILLTRVREGQDVMKSLDNTEIALLRTDKFTLRVLSAGEGFKSWPAISPDGKRIAFWRGELRAQGGGTLAHNYDVYEFSLDDDKTRPFGPSYRFFGVGPLQYLESNELLANADTPTTEIEENNFMTAAVEFGNRTRHSIVYRIKRNSHSLSAPLNFGLDYAQQASSDKFGKIYLFGYDNGLTLRYEDNSRNLKSIPVPTNSISGLILASASPDGRYVAFTYGIGTIPASAGKFALGLFDIANSRWRSLDLPPLSSTEAINIP